MHGPLSGGEEAPAEGGGCVMRTTARTPPRLPGCTRSAGCKLAAGWQYAAGRERATQEEHGPAQIGGGSAVGSSQASVPCALLRLPPCDPQPLPPARRPPRSSPRQSWACRGCSEAATVGTCARPPLRPRWPSPPPSHAPVALRQRLLCPPGRHRCPGALSLRQQGQLQAALYSLPCAHPPPASRLGALPFGAARPRPWRLGWLPFTRSWRGLPRSAPRTQSI
jgi:hypothetical protein